MASRWFVFWMALFVVAAVKGSVLWFPCLFFAIVTDDPFNRLRNEIYGDTKRIVSQFFNHYLGKKEAK